MKTFSKDPAAIDSKCNEWMDKLVIAEKADSFPKLPDNIYETSLGRWYDDIAAPLMAAP